MDEVPLDNVINDESFDNSSNEDEIHFIDADSMAEKDDYFPEEVEKYNSDALSMSYRNEENQDEDDDESSIYSVSSVDFSNSINNADIRNILEISSPTTSLMVAGSAIFVIFSKGHEVIL